MMALEEKGVHAMMTSRGYVELPGETVDNGGLYFTLIVLAVFIIVGIGIYRYMRSISAEAARKEQEASLAAYTDQGFVIAQSIPVDAQTTLLIDEEGKRWVVHPEGCIRAFSDVVEVQVLEDGVLAASIVRGTEGVAYVDSLYVAVSLKDNQQPLLCIPIIAMRTAATGPSSTYYQTQRRTALQIEAALRAMMSQAEARQEA